MRSGLVRLLDLEVAFLGHVIKENGVLVNPQEGDSVVVWKRPRSVSKVRSFLGLVGHYRRFMEGLF